MLIPIWNGAPEGAVDTIPQFPASLTPFPAENGGDTTVIVIPGGGYEKKCWDHEGIRIAEWLSDNNINAFILDYRIVPYAGPAIVADVQRAIRFLRFHAEEYGVNPHKLGVIGFSAGGHLAGCAATMFDDGKADGDEIDRQSCRPDFAILAYPVITMEQGVTHAATRRVFLGTKTPTKEQERLGSLENRVTEQTPPIFLWHTAEDETVPLENSLRMTLACQKKGIPVELHVFPFGPHGLGIPWQEWPDIAQWTDLCIRWMKNLGF